jgi:hypothetical protein
MFENDLRVLLLCDAPGGLIGIFLGQNGHLPLPILGAVHPMPGQLVQHPHLKFPGVNSLLDLPWNPEFPELLFFGQDAPGPDFPSFADFHQEANQPAQVPSLGPS